MPYLIGTIGCLLFVFIVYMVVETYRLRVVDHTFFTNSAQNTTGNTAGKEAVFLHFTDLHLGRTGISNKNMVDVVCNEASDFLVFTGDYFERYKQISLFLSLITEIRKVYSKPIYLCFGNHDHKDVFNKNPGSFNLVVKSLETSGVTILENSSADYVGVKGTISLRIIGLSDCRSNKADIKAVIREGSMGVQPGMPKLLITHNSDILMKMEKGSVDFAVAGHTHGGQIRTPFNVEVKLLHRKDILSSRKGIVRGYHRYNDIDLFISCGIGCVFLPIRFVSRPEIAKIKVRWI